MVNKIWWVGATSPITIRQGGEGPPAGDHHSRPLHRVVSGVGGTPPQPNYLLLFDINGYVYILSPFTVFGEGPYWCKSAYWHFSEYWENDVDTRQVHRCQSCWNLLPTPHAPCQCSQMYCCLCPAWFLPSTEPSPDCPLLADGSWREYSLVWRGSIISSADWISIYLV